MVTKFINTIKKYNMLKKGDKVLCALSGGADSSVMLTLLKMCEEKLGITVCAAHLNHMLRGEEANADEAFARRICEELGIEFVSERADINALAKESGESTELVARKVRYEFLHRAKKTFVADKIATAHNANDNAETILFNLSRGSGIDGVCGIPPVRDDIIRPLIETTRAEIEEYAELQKIGFCVDKTNSETIYSRNKLRHNAIPALVEVNSAAIVNMSRSAGIMRKEAEFLKREAIKAAKSISESNVSCKRKALLNVDEALFSRVCEHFVAELAGNKQYTLEFCHINDIRSLCASDNPSKAVDLPGGIRARCEYELLVFEKVSENKEIEAHALDEGEYHFGEYMFFVKKTENNPKIHNSVNTFLIPCDKIYGNLIVRSRAEHDEIKLLKRPTKSLKKLFVEARVPKNVRESIPVIADEEKVLGVYGFGQNALYLPETQEDVYLIEIKKG